jgi:hypothetical protein
VTLNGRTIYLGKWDHEKPNKSTPASSASGTRETATLLETSLLVMYGVVELIAAFKHKMYYAQFDEADHFSIPCES